VDGGAAVHEPEVGEVSPEARRNERVRQVVEPTCDNPTPGGVGQVWMRFSGRRESVEDGRGQVGGIISIVEADAYCPDVMKQLSGGAGTVGRREPDHAAPTPGDLRGQAMQEGRTGEIVDELMETLKFDKHVFRPPQTPEHEGWTPRRGPRTGRNAGD